VTADLGTPGRVTLSVSGLTGLGNATTELLRLAASVPDSAPYGAKHVLNLSNVLVGGVAARDDDGLHVLVNGEPRLYPVDTVIICAGQEPLRTLFDELVAAGVSTQLIGGAFEAMELDAKRAINQATELAAAA
jgi:hypothetical protein